MDMALSITFPTSQLCLFFSELKMYKEHQPQVAILDISIPHLSGLQLAEKIRAENEDIQIIMLTAFSEQEKLLQAVNLQLFAYLIKPVMQNELDSTLNKLLKKINSSNFLQLAYDYRWNKEEEVLYYQNSAVKLTHKECLIITRLCRYPNRFYTTDELADCFIEDNLNSSDLGQYLSIVQIISRLKRKLLSKYDNRGFFIENIYGAGYKIKK